MTEPCKACTLGFGAHAEDCPNADIGPHPHWIDPNEHRGPTLSNKTYGRIFVRTEADVAKVVEMIKTISEFEHSYMPKDFVAVMPEDVNEAKLVYGHKFEIRTDLLQLACWRAGIEIWIETGHRY